MTRKTFLELLPVGVAGAMATPSSPTPEIIFSISPHAASARFADGHQPIGLTPKEIDHMLLNALLANADVQHRMKEDGQVGFKLITQTETWIGQGIITI